MSYLCLSMRLIRDHIPRWADSRPGQARLLSSVTHTLWYHFRRKLTSGSMKLLSASPSDGLWKVNWLSSIPLPGCVSSLLGAMHAHDRWVPVPETPIVRSCRPDSLGQGGHTSFTALGSCPGRRWVFVGQHVSLDWATSVKNTGGVGLAKHMEIS